MSRELLKQALDALRISAPLGHAVEDYEYRHRLIKDIEAELAKPTQEPVAWAAKSIYGDFEGLSFDKQPRFDTPLYSLDGVTK
jgi:hypothetical protein